MSSQLNVKDGFYDKAIIVILAVFGVYLGVVYFGHRIVPNSDFSCFVRTAREVLSFELPSSYKRGPVLGILQVAVSWFITDSHPYLTAGRLLNAVLFAGNVVLLFLVCKKVVGRAAVWVAVIAAINPWVIEMLTEPLAETTFLFFILLSFLLIFKRSRWSYLVASVTTMVRYEGAALIGIAFVMDMIDSKDNRDRIGSLACAAVASLPFGLWMVGTLLDFKGQGETHYLKELGRNHGR
ncbi:hypothetical protein ACFL3G_13000, partial [Planctomycetota bacterium]